jgi:hypothetical protein
MNEMAARLNEELKIKHGLSAKAHFTGHHSHLISSPVTFCCGEWSRKIYMELNIRISMTFSKE